MYESSREQKMLQEAADAPADERRDAAHERLLAWYAAEGRSHLPWRHTRDPYAVLVSEVMLQQTQVERVLPKYRDFLARFPTLQALAAAPASDVIKAWAGLGYNMRAVRLHEIARQAVAEYGGALPATLDGLLGLKGIGRYTAGAVACFALGLPVATVDTNIRRVLWRVFRGIEPVAWPSGEKAAREALALAEWALPVDRAYDWQQATMDLGATVCVSRRPACERCPLRECCAAYAETARVTLFPSGEALARLRDERHAAGTAAASALALVAEERASYSAAAPGDTSSSSGHSGHSAHLPQADATANSGHFGHAGSAENRYSGHFGHSDQLPSPADAHSDSRNSGHSGHDASDDSGKSGHSGHNSGKNGRNGKNGKSRERFEESSRYFRGRIVAALRDLEAGATLPLDVLGPHVRDGYTQGDAAWLRTLALGLARDGLARVETGPQGEERVGLP